MIMITIVVVAVMVGIPVAKVAVAMLAATIFVAAVTILVMVPVVFGIQTFGQHPVALCRASLPTRVVRQRRCRIHEIQKNQPADEPACRSNIAPEYPNFVRHPTTLHDRSLLTRHRLLVQRFRRCADATHRVSGTHFGKIHIAGSKCWRWQTQ